MQVSKRRGFVLMATLFGAAAYLSSRTVVADEYGTLKGQFVLKGEIPEPTLLVKKGDPNSKDPDVCAATDLYGDDLVVDRDTKGIANIFVYLRTATKVHPDLMATPADKKKVVFDQKGCRFIPHCLVLRTDQVVVVKSSDNCAHNTNFIPINNRPDNFIVPRNDRVGHEVAFSSRELLPMPVKCDIHSWMKAHWLILDHPYAAKTDERGHFTIEKLPAGEHQFRVWHERMGWINIDNSHTVTKNLKDTLTVKIGGGETALEPIEVPVERLTQKK